jgi:hypothetical protein
MFRKITESDTAVIVSKPRENEKDYARGFKASERSTDEI